jgi:capsular polysaccharide biosynthesis protein
LRALCPQERFRIRYVKEGRLYGFEELYFATPVTYHPYLKSPEALHYTGTALRKRETGPATRRIFVTRRRSRGRTIINLRETEGVLESMGFSIIDPEAINFQRQVSAFATAGLVVGSMGAAMTNTMFCPPGTKLVYLAPAGWREPFYWDLAAACGHEYHVCFGTGEPANAAPYDRSYAIDSAMLEAALRPSLDLPKRA